jgi:phenylacetate-CoA ligase
MLEPRREDLEAIELASCEEIAALRLKRLKCSLRRVYESVRHYRGAFDRAGVHPDDLATLADLAKFLHVQGGLASPAIPSNGPRCRATRSCASTLRPAPPGSPPWWATPGAIPEWRGPTTIPVSGGITERQVQLIVDFEPNISTVTPSYMLAILDQFRRQCRDPRATSLKVGIFGAEP